ncbi:UDP-4-amino-4,6-dideoxy-N-acetyl-beta-L-altrosamine N-acetyltransferase [Desulfovibrio sp. UCD-KL4C]|uniref:UDP-4-amino-4, 6-dideoxy-N-acetyl-beta-L-altrosamine N-acetyltransferase n=1 Tax=Desulfovibrio sp. UCD-KL4C TaxID=2578120 RepID=UPI0025C458C5|nr:UDP-4-amino-4,6-dideoxy-N-acetyl-beta-L-altrosamine N-acetyltransferase [Desulfovibrio sp. UCD-KL4C]
MDLTLIPFYRLSLEEMNEVLTWRNNIFVRQQMCDSSIIPIENHLNFIENLKSDTKNEYYLVVKNKCKIGVIYLTEINSTNAELGLYKNPNLKKEKVGQQLMKAIFYIAHQKNLHDLTLKVLKNNEKALALYSKFYFKIYKQDNDFLYMNAMLNNGLKD